MTPNNLPFPILVLTLVASSAVEANRMVTQAGAYPSAGGLAFASTRVTAEQGQAFIGVVMGIATVEAGAAFDQDVPLMVGSDGAVVAHDGSGDKHAIGRSLVAATQAGQLVTALLIPASGQLPNEV